MIRKDPVTPPIGPPLMKPRPPEVYNARPNSAPAGNPNSKRAIEQQILQSLLRMYPDQSPADLSRLAKQLAGEYEAERYEALQEMQDGPPGPDTLEGAGLPKDYQGEWRWDGRKIVPVDQDYLDGQRRARERQEAERDWNAAKRENIANNRGNKRSRAGYGERRLQPVFGMAEPIPPASTGTPYGQQPDDAPRPAAPYGERIGKTGPSLGNFIDVDGDGVDDRYQTGPGAPKQGPSMPQAAWMPPAAPGRWESPTRARERMEDVQNMQRQLKQQGGLRGPTPY